MTELRDTPDRPDRFDQLRHRVEALSSSLPPGDSTASAEILRLIEELRREQAELQTRNKELALARKTLLQSEQNLRHLFENASQPYHSLDEEGQIQAVNQKWLTTMGYSKEEVLDRWFGTFLDPPSLEQFQHHFDLSRQGRPMDRVEYTLISKNRERIVGLFSGRAQWDQKGRFLCLHCFFTDITERRNLEAQLLQAQKMQAVGTLAGGIAHNFNNVLMGIQGRTSLLLMNKEESDPEATHLKGIEKDVKRATALAKDLLGFARQGKSRGKPTDLNELIANENALFNRTKKEITFHSSFQDGLWPVQVDRDQMRQTFMNLYLNAWQAMPGGGDIVVQTMNCTIQSHQTNVKHFQITPGRYVGVSVSDFGIGMDEATRDKIFEPFFTTQDIGKGTGLGLASVYGIIKNHDGFIDVFSVKGEGTTFNLYLPACNGSARQPAAEPVAGTIHYGRGTVLLVNDEEQVLQVNRELLEKLGYTVLTARNGHEALAVFARHRDGIRLVMLDMIMPKMGGAETFDRLKEMDPKVRVLLCSGYNVNQEVNAVLDRGCQGFIQKPFSLEQLSAKIREVLGR